MRILGLQGTPFASDPTQIKAIVAQPEGWIPQRNSRGQEPRVDWFLCDESLLNNPSLCVQSSANLQWIGEGTAIATQPEWLQHNTPRVLFSTYCYGERARWLSERGSLGCPDEASLPYPQTQGVVAFKVLQPVAGGAATNHNPVIDKLFVNGELSEPLQWTLPRCTTASGAECPSFAIRVRTDSVAVETLPDGTREQLTASFYALSGRFDRPRDVTTSEVAVGQPIELSARWTPSTNAETTGFAVVLRDDRGGLSVVYGQIVVQ